MDGPLMEPNDRPALDFLRPERFRTGFDEPALGREQFAKGVIFGQTSAEVGVSANGTWYAIGRLGSLTTSSEKIGYHANTAELLRGFVASGCRVVVHRHDGSKTAIIL